MNNKVFVPPIKSQGIKTKLVPWISTIVPDEIEGRWVEPFMGTGVVGFNLAPKRALLCDTNPHLVEFYSSLQQGEITAPIVRAYLEKEGQILLDSDGEHYYKVRERFNEHHEPLDFLFLNRSGFNGMIRFNRKGGFNIPFCKKPNRFAKAYVTKIVNQVDTVEKILADKKIEFKCQSFAETIGTAKETDLIYCDPPYIGRHVDYFNSWDELREQELKDSLSDTKAHFILSTWHHNDFRENEYIEKLWNSYHVLTKEHFYHVGASESNRNPMMEAIVTNIKDAEIRVKKFIENQNKQINLI